MKSPFKNIALLKELSSPENPGALEKRVALFPADVKKFVDNGFNFFVEDGAGLGLNISNAEYIAAGAVIQNHEQIYSNKDFLIKLKGLALNDIEKINPGSVLMCMAHNHSFPDRAKKILKNKIKLICMEEILETPKHTPDHIIFSKHITQKYINENKLNIENRNVFYLGYSKNLIGSLRRIGNRNSKILKVINPKINLDSLKDFAHKLIITDSNDFNINEHIKNEDLLDLSKYYANREEIIKDYRDAHPPFEIGGRRIQCLHETGMAGARYGLKLLAEKSEKALLPEKAKAVVIGYGNVGMGAIDELYQQGVAEITILTKCTTAPEKILSFIKDADIIVNGADQAPELRGKNYLLTSDHCENLLEKGTVVIDLVGGSPVNRSAVEDVIECTFLNAPYFEKYGILFSALWGWPMMGMERESALRYSGQITDILLQREKILFNWPELNKGVKNAFLGDHK